MSDRYLRRFQALSREGRKAFIPFALLGWPDRRSFLSMVKTMLDSGVSALELGLAFSDPLADGPVISAAAQETLASGFTVKDAFELIAAVRALDDDIPIGILAYYNMVLAAGVKDFYAAAAGAGVDGILIADLPPESAEEVAFAGGANGIEQIFIISPLTSKRRLQMILRHAGGFLYVVSRLGITGMSEVYDRDLESLLSLIRSSCTLPACVGFGISSAAQAERIIAMGADGVITGSKVIDIVSRNRSSFDGVLGHFCRSMVDAVSAAATTG